MAIWSLYSDFDTVLYDKYVAVDDGRRWIF